MDDRINYICTKVSLFNIAKSKASTALLSISSPPISGGEHAAVADAAVRRGLPGLRAVALELLHHVQALGHLSEHDVLAVEPLGLHRANEELRPVGVGPGVHHTQDPGAGVLVHEVLVRELLAVDGLAPGPIAHGEIAALDHEIWNNPVEHAALVAEALLPGAERAEVLAGLGHVVSVQLELNASQGLAARGDIEEDLGHGGGVIWKKRERRAEIL